MFSYPVDLEPDDNGTVLASIPDLPGTVTFGEDEAEALARAVDALETMFIGLMSRKEDIPAASKPRQGQKIVTLPVLSAAKVSLYQAMRDAGIRKAELGRRLGWHMPQVDRLLDLRHISRIDQIETALRVLGKEVIIELREVA